MSELKAHWITTRSGNPLHCYLKSEADKVIAELKMKLAATQQVLRLNKPEALYSDLETIGRLKHETDVVARRERHHKYKRCLEMASWCDEVMMSCELRGYAVHRIWANRHQWAMRWKYRWLELAKKFKEEK